MKLVISKVIAVLEVVLVRFALIPLLYWGINNILPQLEEW